MLFHTWIFALFFLLTYPVYLLLRDPRLRVAWLLVCSYVFYGWWNWHYLILIAFTTMVDYGAARCMHRTGRRKLWLCVSIAANLAMLGFFKYGDFVVANLNAALGCMGAPWAPASPSVLLPAGVPYLLPVGISFFVFQSMSYTIDVYRGHMEPEPNFVRYAAFVSLFPQLVAGPIERARRLLPQLRRPAPITLERVADGASLFLVGLFKKLALADYLALYVNRIYAAPTDVGAPDLLLATVVFGWQIYFDFSGYSDMARGLGKMLGIDLMLNFRNPYLATGLRDFWRRWHISLSTWFRDYVYIPLGGNRLGGVRTYVNMALAMLLSGLWHGAAWHFVAWGCVHAAGSSIARGLAGTGFSPHRLPRWARRLGVFAFVSFAWVFFRAQSLGEAVTILGRMATGPWTAPHCPALMLLLIVAVWGYQFLYESRGRWILEPRAVRIALVVAMILYVATAPARPPQPFIYFQF